MKWYTNTHLFSSTCYYWSHDLPDWEGCGIK